MEYRIEVNHDLYGWIGIEEGVSEVSVDEVLAGYRADGGEVRAIEIDDLGLESVYDEG